MVLAVTTNMKSLSNLKWEVSLDEQRKKLRLTVEIPAKIRFNGITQPGVVRNLSCGGIFIQTPEPLQGEDSCELILSLPDGRGPMVLQSEVVWQAPNLESQEDAEMEETSSQSEQEMQSEESSEEDVEENSKAGLKFHELEPEQKARINEFIRRNIREDLH